MQKNDPKLLEFLKFELNFLEDGGYGRSPRTPWRAMRVFEDSPSCLNFADPSRPHPCGECLLMQFVPDERKHENSPCRFIPLTDKSETIDSFYRYGTQPDLEETLAAWLRKQISRIQQGNSDEPESRAVEEPTDEFSKLAET